MKNLLIALFVFTSLTACFAKKMDHLSWKHLENSSITNFEYNEDKASETVDILSADNERLRLRVFERPVKTDAFKAYAVNTLDIIQSFYKEFESPYPADISQKVVCTSELKPRALPHVATSDLFAEGLLVYGNSRYTYGDCDPKELKFETLHALVHCKRANTSYEIKYFIPKSESSTKTLESVYASLKCKT